MATVNLGRIKPVFRGAFNNSTAYVIDDIVTSGNETFIAIAATQGNATSNGSFWTKLAAKGADGTDVAATLANKEIAFKTNAGALDGIPIGTAGQFLKVNSGATGYEFGTQASAGVLQTVRYGTGTPWTQSMSGTSFTQINNGATDFDVTITPSATSNSILIFGQLNVQMYPNANNYAGSVRVVRSVAGGSTNNTFQAGNAHGSRPRGTFWTATNSAGYEPVTCFSVSDTGHNTTSAITYKLELIAHGNHTVTFNYHNNHGDGSSGYHSQAFSTIMAQELGHTIADA
ncbi:MAG: hypothetical protein CBC16_01335 [Verrucomicrobia bacterium TMED56]|nr:MAG: hypothetical protein CBC16_01335 [Verrucomicrobia bacterium TMED56]